MGIEVFKQGLELFADQWQAPGTINFYASGDLDDYISFSVTSNRPLITGVGNYLVLGKDATTGHSLDADDVIFGEDVEIDGVLYCDSNIEIGANKLKTTNLLIKEYDAASIAIRNSADDAYLSIHSLVFISHDAVRWDVSPGAMWANSVNDAYVIIKAYKTDDVQSEVARWAGAADPYFGLGVDGAGIKVTNGNLVGFFAATPVAQQTYPGAALTANYGAGDLDTEAELRTAINANATMVNLLRGAVINLGLTAAS